MGVGKSRHVPFSYEEACKRVDKDVVTRIEETFRRVSTGTGHLPQTTFTRDILGDGMPAKLAEELYHAFGGTQKGISLKDLMCGLVLLAHGSVDEKAKFLSQLLSADGASVTRDAVLEMVRACDMEEPSSANMETLFQQQPFCSVEHFEKWLKDHPHLSSFTRWLLVPGESGFSLQGKPDPPTFYQTLGEQYGVSEREVMDLERTYWGLKSGGSGTSGKFDVEAFQKYASPPVPENLCKGLFDAFDENSDGQLDLAEMVRAVGWCCRSIDHRRHKLCFKVFDEDRDSLLSRDELSCAVSSLQTVLRENTEEETSQDLEDEQRIVEAAMQKFSKTQEGYLSEDEYVEWAESATPLSLALIHVLYQVCHIRFGLRPRTKTDETSIVGGYLLRFHKTGKKPGDTVYIITGEWFKQWKAVTGYERSSSAASSGKKKKKKDKHRHKKHSQPRPESPQVHTETVAIPSATQSYHPGGGGGGGPVERGEDVVELLTVAQCGNKQSSSNSSFTSLSDSELSQVTAMESVPEDKRLPLINNSTLLVCDLSVRKYTSLTNEGGFMLKNEVLMEGNQFFFLPNVVWRVFTSWYGTAGHQGGPALPRIVRPDGTVDFYPVQFKVYRHTTLPPPAKPSSLPWPIASVFGTLGITSPKPVPSSPLSSAGVISGGTEGGPIQPPLPRRVLYYYAAFIESTTIEEMSEYIEKVLHVKSEDLRLYSLSNEENPVHLDDETMTVADLKFTDGQKLLLETRNKDNSWPEEIIAVMKEVRAKDKESKENKDTDKQHHSDVQVPQGATGLSNLGNTCFMNSALQCVSNAQPLTRYFKEKDYLLEINKDNPLGMGGVMAKRYGELVQDLWNGRSKSITPLKFRFTVGRCAPRFNGFQQQDAQELLAFVLDGLHEDLNRVKEKPYKELKDSDGRPEDEVSREAWDYHLSRNHSVIVDLFQGQLKSVVRCKVCDYKSMRFDPFTFLSLPLPMESTVDLEIVVVRLDGSQPVRYGVKLEIDEKYRALRQSLADLTGIRKSNLLLVEMYGSMIRKYPPDSTKIRSQLGGWLYAFEIPDPPPSPTFRTITVAIPSSHLTVTTTTTTTTTANHLPTETVEAEQDEKKAGDSSSGGNGQGDRGGGERGEDVVGAAGERGGLDGKELESGNESGGGEERGREGGEGRTTETASGGGEEKDEERIHSNENASMESRNSSTDDIDISVNTDLRPPLDRPLGSRDPTPPILLAPEDDDRLTGNAATGFRAVGGQQLEEEVGPGMAESHEPGRDSGELNSQSVSPSHSGGFNDGFIFAIHRKTFLVEQYFVASQKSRPLLFGTPVVIPCMPDTPCREVYELVWRSIERLIIPDKPSANKESKEKRGFPFTLATVGKDGLSCATCPWHKFCRGCPIKCDNSAIGDSSPYIAIDWDVNTLHLKYQSAQERPVEHESMESLKIMELDPIDLYECFKAFVREDDLGDEECWYCKQCKKHQEAVKSLEIWRLPPILIIHLKRFQFFNGRWVKSQRVVRFPASNLDPLRYTVQNGNGTMENGTETDRIGTETQTSGSQPVEGQNESSSLPKGQPETPESRVVESDICGSPNIANGGEHPLEPPPSSDSTGGGAEGGERKSKSSDELNETLHRRKGNIYNLFAITCHSGMLGGGHYTSFCRNPNGKWYYFNDSSCKETTEERIVQESPYMLFYEMKDLDHYYNLFRAQKGGKQQDISSTEDDKAYEETLRNLSKKCCIQ